MNRLFILLYSITTFNLYGQEFDASNFRFFHYKSSIDIYSVINNGIEEYRWKSDNKKLSGFLEFMCEIDGGGGIYEGYEGKGIFINGFRDGEWFIMDCSSSVYHIINYYKGLVMGKYKVYFKYNKPIKKKKGNYSYTEYIRADSLLYETDFVDGNGVWKDFYYQGGIKETGEYKSGKKEREWLYYTENSFLYKKIYYEGGMPVDSVIIEIPDSLKIEKQMPH